MAVLDLYLKVKCPKITKIGIITMTIPNPLKLKLQPRGRCLTRARMANSKKHHLRCSQKYKNNSKQSNKSKIGTKKESRMKKEVKKAKIQTKKTVNMRLRTKMGKTTLLCTVLN